MDFFDVLRQRRSVRQFSDEAIPEESISRILLAANSAPVGSSLYRDIHLTVVRNREILDRLCEAAQKRFENRANLEKIIGDIKPENLPSTVARDPFYGARTVIFVSHRNQTVQPGIEFSNAACVAYTMHLAAAEMGLGSVFIWGVLESMREIPELDNTGLLHLPDGFAPILGVALGHPAKILAPREIKTGKLAVDYL